MSLAKCNHVSLSGDGSVTIASFLSSGVPAPHRRSFGSYKPTDTGGRWQGWQTVGILLQGTL